MDEKRVLEEASVKEGYDLIKHRWQTNILGRK